MSEPSPAEQIRAFVKTYAPYRLAELRGVHLFPDRIIRLPKYGNGVKKPEAQWLEGASARVESGSTVDISALHASAPGGFAASNGVAKPRELWLVIDGPTFQWQVRLPAHYVRRARGFVESLNTAARQNPPQP